MGNGGNLKNFLMGDGIKLELKGGIDLREVIDVSGFFLQGLHSFLFIYIIILLADSMSKFQAEENCYNPQKALDNHGNFSN